ncbi:MAG: FAD-binding oxidoreductase [Planctomycetes bacterium]|nr:FAD-binding oxidoreductase [Planctomycetota bacterium]
MRVAVIGAGIIGCSSALELTRKGFEVTVLDRLGEAGHGTTGASCGIVRRFYSRPEMISVAHEAASIWAAWPEHVGPIGEETAVFHRPGVLFLFPRLDETVERAVAHMTKIGVRFALLSAAQVRERFPYLDTASYFPAKLPDDPAFLAPSSPEIGGAIFEEDSGYVVSPGLATHNVRLAAEREGVRFRLNREVVEIRKAAPGRFDVVTRPGEVLEAEALLNAAGPHSARVNDLAGVRLPLTTRALRREVHAVPNPLWQEPGADPLPVVGDLDGGIYFRPETGGKDLIVGSSDPECDPKEWLDDPDNCEGRVTDPYRERQCLRLMRRFPRVRLGPRRGIASLYDVTVEDWYPIVDRTDLPGYYVAIGTSGSSFKTAPVLGRLVAEIVQACEGGRDTDRDPVRLELPRTGQSVDGGFLSRRRGPAATTGTVIG